MEQIAKNVKYLIKQWRKQIADKSSEPVSPHPSQQILNLLEQAYHHPEFPRDLDIRYRELKAEVSSAVSKWPSITGHDDELAVIQHVENFIKLLSKAEPKQRPPEGKKWSRHMPKADMMQALRIDSYKKFKAIEREYGIKDVGVIVNCGKSVWIK